MKKYLFALLFCLVTVVSFMSCSKDEEGGEGSSSIVGKWQLVEVTDKEEYEPCEFEGFTQFADNGVWRYENGCTNGKGTWKLSGETLTLTPDILPIPVSITVIAVNKSTLVIEQTIGSIKNRETYKRL